MRGDNEGQREEGTEGQGGVPMSKKRRGWRAERRLSRGISRGMRGRGDMAGLRGREQGSERYGTAAPSFQ